MGNHADVTWRKAGRCGGNVGDQSGEGEESCVEVAAIVRPA